MDLQVASLDPMPMKEAAQQIAAFIDVTLNDEVTERRPQEAITRGKLLPRDNL